MSFLSSIPLLGSLFTTVSDKLLVDKGPILEAQSRINEKEVEGAPVSRLRLWRSFLGWCLALAVVWVIILRPAILFYFPDAPLFHIEEFDRAVYILIGMLGLSV